MDIDPQRLLVIRRDSIGDLLCTTPAVHALRRHYPSAQIAVLTNSYSAPVLARNPDVDRVYAYVKAKHVAQGRIRAYWNEWQLYRELRKQRFDLIVHANPTPHDRTAKLARYLRGKHRLGVVATRPNRAYDIAVTPNEISGTHHVEQVMSLLLPLGITVAPGPLELVPPGRDTIPEEQRMVRDPDQRLLAVHISSRLPGNRWDFARFGDVIASLPERWRVALFWNPGSSRSRPEPGDDQEATKLAAAHPKRIRPFPTPSLADLIAGFAQCDAVLCAAGGAMHVGAALGKPTVALFGCTDPQIWGPWRVPQVILRGNGHINDIAANDVTAAILRLADPERSVA